MSLGINPEPVIYGLDEPVVVGGQPNITCEVRYFWSENVSFMWFLQDKEVAGFGGDRKKHKDNSAIFTYFLDHNFTQFDDMSYITCSVLVNNTILWNHEVKTTRILNLYCKFPSHLVLVTYVL